MAGEKLVQEPKSESISHWGLHELKPKAQTDYFAYSKPLSVKAGVMSNAKYDVSVVNSPSHYSYNHKGIECIDAMEAMLTVEEFIGYLRGNIFKYQWRYRYKNGMEDLAKAKWYSARLDKVLAANPAFQKNPK